MRIGPTDAEGNFSSPCHQCGLWYYWPYGHDCDSCDSAGGVAFPPGLLAVLEGRRGSKFTPEGDRPAAEGPGPAGPGAPPLGAPRAPEMACDVPSCLGSQLPGRKCPFGPHNEIRAVKGQLRMF